MLSAQNITIKAGPGRQAGGVAQALRHIATAIPATIYHDRLQMSKASTTMYTVYFQFSGPLRKLITYSSLNDLYGAKLSNPVLTEDVLSVAGIQAQWLKDGNPDGAIQGGRSNPGGSRG